MIAAEIEDGSCLQIGIGGMPNAVCSLLLESGREDLGVHTEMLTDGIMDLYQPGWWWRTEGTPSREGRLHVRARLGRLYAAIDRNDDLLCLPVDQTNLPHIIMQNDRVISINNTTQIDLQGQAASESDGHRHISGTGGHCSSCAAPTPQWGKSFMCLASTYEKGGVRTSRIVLDLTPGNIATTREPTSCTWSPIRHGQPQRKVRGRASDGTHLHRASRLP